MTPSSITTAKARVYKRHDTYSGSTRHFHEVRYLPGLEIRSKDNTEQLHVISLATGGGHVVCLHWLSGKPPGVADNQLRYTLNDHLGSCVMELDQQARLISHEGYYPFGATAWMSANSAVEIDYKTLRYSGKEMDVSGCITTVRGITRRGCNDGQCGSGGRCRWAEPVCVRG
jgi:insecticidal toxin complex protein TccC